MTTMTGIICLLAAIAVYHAGVSDAACDIVSAQACATNAMQPILAPSNMDHDTLCSQGEAVVLAVEACYSTHMGSCHPALTNAISSTNTQTLEEFAEYCARPPEIIQVTLPPIIPTDTCDLNTLGLCMEPLMYATFAVVGPDLLAAMEQSPTFDIFAYLGQSQNLTCTVMYLIDVVGTFHCLSNYLLPCGGNIDWELESSIILHYCSMDCINAHIIRGRADQCWDEYDVRDELVDQDIPALLTPDQCSALAPVVDCIYRQYGCCTAMRVAHIPDSQVWSLFLIENMCPGIAPELYCDRGSALTTEMALEEVTTEEPQDFAVNIGQENPVYEPEEIPARPPARPPVAPQQRPIGEQDNSPADGGSGEARPGDGEFDSARPDLSSGDGEFGSARPIMSSGDGEMGASRPMSPDHTMTSEEKGSGTQHSVTSSDDNGSGTQEPMSGTQHSAEDSGSETGEPILSLEDEAESSGSGTGEPILSLEDEAESSTQLISSEEEISGEESSENSGSGAQQPMTSLEDAGSGTQQSMMSEEMGSGTQQSGTSSEESESGTQQPMASVEDDGSGAGELSPSFEDESSAELSEEMSGTAEPVVSSGDVASGTEQPAVSSNEGSGELVTGTEEASSWSSDELEDYTAANESSEPSVLPTRQTLQPTVGHSTTPAGSVSMVDTTGTATEPQMAPAASSTVAPPAVTLVSDTADATDGLPAESSGEPEGSASAFSENADSSAGSATEATSQSPSEDNPLAEVLHRVSRSINMAKNNVNWNRLLRGRPLRP